MKMNLAAIAVAALVCFIMGALWYSPLLFGNTYLTLRGLDAGASAASPAPAALVAEFVRCVIVAYTFAYFLLRVRIDSTRRAVALAVRVWIGFQAFMLLGSVLHESYPLGLFAIHAGDALAKAVLNCLILTWWHKRAGLVGGP